MNKSYEEIVDKFKAVDQFGNAETVYIFQEVIVVETRDEVGYANGRLRVATESGEHLNRVSDDVFETTDGETIYTRLKSGSKSS